MDVTAGFPQLAAPFARQVYAGGRSFPQCIKAALVANTFTHLKTIPPSRSLMEITAGALLNRSSNSDTSLSLEARVANVAVGQATLILSQTDGASVAQQIGVNTPGFFRLLLWPGIDQRWQSAGYTVGGIVTIATTLGGVFFPALNATALSTASRPGSPLEIGVNFVSNGASDSGDFTLDWLRVFEYPDAQAMWG